MAAEDLLSFAEGDTPAPLLIIEEPGLGYAGLARQAAEEWAEQPVQDFSSLKLSMSKGGDGLGVRELLHGLSLKAGSRRAVIISLAGSSLEVQNALLKTLEEPPNKTWVIVLADSGGVVLPTVRSRCSVLQASPLTSDELALWAKDRSIEASEEELAYAAGNPGRLEWMVENREAVSAAISGQVPVVLSALNDQEKPAPWLGQLLAVLCVAKPSPHVAEARRLSLSGVRPELVLAAAFLL